MKKLVILAALGAAVAHSAWKPRKRWIWSAVAVVAASVADTHSSYGGYEANPVLRGPDGRFGRRGLAIKWGLVAGLLTGETFLLRWCPDAEPVATGSNIAVAGGIGSVAARNYRVR